MRLQARWEVVKEVATAYNGCGRSKQKRTVVDKASGPS